MRQLALTTTGRRALTSEGYESDTRLPPSDFVPLVQDPRPICAEQATMLGPLWERAWSFDWLVPA